MLGPPAVVESLGAAEVRSSFRVGDSWCRMNAIDLRAGVRLGVTACQFEPSFSFSAVQPPSEIELVVSKGSVLRARTADSRDLPRGGNTLQLGRTGRPLPLEIRPEGDGRMECVSVSMSELRLRELLGVPELPAAFREVTESASPAPLVSRDMTAGLFRLLEEIVNADAKGASRALWHEAKALELIALMTDELMEADRAARAPSCRPTMSIASSAPGCASSRTWRRHPRSPSWPGRRDSARPGSKAPSGRYSAIPSSAICGRRGWKRRGASCWTAGST